MQRGQIPANLVLPYAVYGLPQLLDLHDDVMLSADFPEQGGYVCVAFVAVPDGYDVVSGELGVLLHGLMLYLYTVFVA